MFRCGRTLDQARAARAVLAETALTIACLRDLRRWWNEFGQDDDDRIVARLMAECGLFGNDLVPILKISAESGSKGFKTAVATINLMLLMTWPVNVAEELRDAALMDQDLSKVDYAGLQAILRTYKASIVRSKSVQHIFAVLVQILEKKKSELVRDLSGGYVD